VAQPSSPYEACDPTSTILYGIVRDHFETFRAHGAALRDGEGLPRFVEQEFRDFLAERFISSLLRDVLGFVRR